MEGGGVWETYNASAASPTWNFAVKGLEETVNLAMMAAPPRRKLCAAEQLGRHRMRVHTDLNATQTRGPIGWFTNGNSSDMAWSTPSYMAAIGIPHSSHSNASGCSVDDEVVTAK